MTFFYMRVVQDVFYVLLVGMISAVNLYMGME